MKKMYKNFGVLDGIYVANTSIGEETPVLPSGAYKINYDGKYNVLNFEPMTLTSDSIIDLPSPEYSRVVSEMKKFLEPTTRAQFQKLGFLYKRSCLLHGIPGGGKSIIVNRVAREAIKNGGVVLYTSDPNELQIAFKALEDIQPDTLCLVIFEELDAVIEECGQKPLLLLLDGQTQKQNVMYLATTNYLNRIPKRIYRPGRFSSVIEVGTPNAEARQVFLETKLGKDFKPMKQWVKDTEGCTVDELKEVIQAVQCFGYDLHETIERIGQTRAGKKDEEEEFERDEGSFDLMNEIMSNMLGKSNKRRGVRLID